MARKKKEVETTAPAAEAPVETAAPEKKKRGRKAKEKAAEPAAEAPAELTPLEEAAMSADSTASSEAAGAAVDASSEATPETDPDFAEVDQPAEAGVDEAFVENDGQVAMFPSEAKMVAKEVDITEAYKSVQARLKSIGEGSKFFRSFASYMAELDPGPEGDVCQENLKAALVRCDKMAKDLAHALAQLRKIDELEEQLAELSAAFAKAGGKKQTNCPTVKMLPSETEVLGQLGKALQPHVPELQDDDADEDDEATLENFENAARRGEGHDPEAAVTHREPITDDSGEVVGEKLTIDPTQHGANEELDEQPDDVDDSSEQFADEIDDEERRQSLVSSHE